MGMMRYKGYTGSVEYSEDDNCLFGKVQGLDKRTCILYEGNTVDELKTDFENAIDSYLESCKERGVVPRQPYSGTLNIRISPEIHSKNCHARAGGWDYDKWLYQEGFRRTA